MAWVYLAVAILAELIGTLGLRSVAGSLTWWSVTLIVVAYGASFATMALALRQLNVGVVYAIWSAVGTAAVAGAGVVLFDERLSWGALGGMALIVVGVVVLVASGSVRHA